MKQLPGKRARHSGFSLLEAIVAMVLISGAGLAIFAWINASLDSFRRVQEANQRADATVNVLEFMHTVNPMSTPEGEAVMGNYSIRWRAEPVEPAVAASGPGGGSAHRVGLYRVGIVVRDSAQAPWFELQVRQVGHRYMGVGAQ